MTTDLSKLPAGESAALELSEARIELRDANLRMRTHVQSPYRPVAWDMRLRDSGQSDLTIACANAPLRRRASANAAS